MAKRYAHVINNVVDNVVLFEDQPLWSPKEGLYISIEGKTGAGIGATYDPETEEFTPVVVVVPEEESVQNIYLHATLTDGDGLEPIGIVNDNTDTMNVSATFRTSEEADSTVITAINSSWRITIRNSNDAVYDIIKVMFVNGVTSFNYKTTLDPAVCHIDENDFDQITMGDTTYNIVIIGNTEFKVYRTL